jgi:ABC-type transport system substrate-binding protein
MSRMTLASAALFSTLTMMQEPFALARPDAPFEAAFVGIATPPDTRDVGNTGDYYLLLNLVRPLIGYGDHAQVVGDALAKWSFNDAFTVFDFTLSSDLTFSNGEAVTAQDAVRTLERMMRIGKAIHYDFTNFAKVEATGARQFRITLKSSDRNLLEAMNAPEFAPLHKSDYSASSLSFRVTTGPYVIKDAGSKTLLLEKNARFRASSGPASVRIHSIAPGDLENLDPKLYDFIPPARIDKSIHKRFEDAGLSPHRLNLAYTHFVGLNADRPVLKDVAARRFIQQVLATKIEDVADFAPSIGPARQLYLPDGPGRVPEARLVEIEKTIETAKRPALLKPTTSLDVLVGPSPLSGRVIVEKLKKAGFAVNVTTYKDWAHFAKLIKEEKFDLVEANNDFSAMELLENLRVTFNPGRPLIQLPKGSSIVGDLEKAVTIEDPEKRYAIFETIEHQLLDRALIVPLYHSYSQVYLRKSYSADAWNKSVPEMALWKLRKL